METGQDRKLSTIGKHTVGLRAPKFTHGLRMLSGRGISWSPRLGVIIYMTRVLVRAILFRLFKTRRVG